MRLALVCSLASFAALTAACSTVPVDQNVAGLAASAERQQAAAIDAQVRRDEAQAKRDEARFAAAKSCAERTGPEVLECMAGVALVGATGGAAGGAVNLDVRASLPNYQRPPMAGEVAAQLLRASAAPLGVIGTAYVAVEREETNREISANDTARQIATVQAQAGTAQAVADQLGNVAAEFSGALQNLPPSTSITLGDGGVVAGGDVEQNDVAGVQVDGSTDTNIGDRNDNTGRQDSPDNGINCTEATCEQPPPAPEG